MRPVPRISKPVLSDDEVRAALKADGAKPEAIDAAIAERRAARDAVQAEYDGKQGGEFVKKTVPILDIDGKPTGATQTITLPKA